MAKQFDLILTNRWKATAVVVGGVGLLGVVAAAAIAAVERFSSVAASLVGLGLLFGWGFWFIPQAAQWFCTELAIATFDEEGLTVHFPATAATRRVRFIEMASYNSPFNEGFIVRLHHGPALRLHLNHRLQPQGLEPLWAFRRHFQRAVVDYHKRHPNQPLILERGFFSQPVATAALGLFAALVGWEGWRALRSFGSEGAWGRFLFLGFLFSIYALVWWHHRKQPEQ